MAVPLDSWAIVALLSYMSLKLRKVEPLLVETIALLKKGLKKQNS